MNTTGEREDLSLIPSALTTRWGGIGIIVASTISILLFVMVWLPGGAGIQAVFAVGPLAQLVASMLLTAGLAILAFGMPGEIGIVGRSRLGGLGLVIFGASQLASDLLSLLSSQLSDRAAVAASPAYDILVVLPLVAGVFAAIAIVRAGVLTGYSRWSFVVLVGWQILVFIAGLFGGVMGGMFGGDVVSQVSLALSLLLVQFGVGVSYLIDNRQVPTIIETDATAQPVSEL